MMKSSWIATILLTLICATPLHAQSTGPDRAAEFSQPASPEISKRLTSKVQSWIGDQRYKVEGVRTTPIPGLFEVQVRTDLFFVDETGSFIILEGEMVDMRSNLNLTRERMKQVMAIDFSDLPLEKAIKNVNGDGKRIMVVFEDPNCSYCRRLRADLNDIDNLTIYTFAFPILAADSDVKSRKALCAEDPAKAWNDLMLYGKVPSNDGSCPTAIDEIKAMGQRWGISATPTVFFPSGYRLRGYAPPARFAKLLDKHQVAK